MSEAPRMTFTASYKLEVRVCPAVTEVNEGVAPIGRYSGIMSDSCLCRQLPPLLV